MEGEDRRRFPRSRRNSYRENMRTAPDTAERSRQPGAAPTKSLVILQEPYPKEAYESTV
jgi:hypothetical protein